jgi:hypothetical protein
MRNVRDLIRAWCAKTGYPLSELMWRARTAREHGLIRQGGKGVNAPAATLLDAIVLLLSTIVSQFAKDVPEDVVRYAGLRLLSATYSMEPDKDKPPPTGMTLRETSLLDALLLCFLHYGPQSEIRPTSLRATQSKTAPSVFLTLGLYAPGQADGVVSLRFVKQDQLDAPLRPDLRDGAVLSAELPGDALMAMRELFAANAQPENDTGPSAPTDEPGLLDHGTTVHGDNHGPTGHGAPRASKPETTPDKFEVSAGSIFNQSHGFESFGAPSGGPVLPPLELRDDRRPKGRRRPSRPDPRPT